MSDIFQKKLKLIDKNIKELNSNTLGLKESLELLKETTNLLNSANNIILSQNNTIDNETNNFLLGNSIEKYYKELLNRKKIISDLTEKYKDMVKEAKLKTEEESISNSDNETDTLLNKNRQQVELIFTMNKNEALINKGQKGLEEIKDNIGEIQNNINQQKNDLEEMEQLIIDNDKRTYEAEGIVDSALNDKIRNKLILVITNILLFLLIIAVVIYKFLK